MGLIKTSLIGVGAVTVITGGLLAWGPLSSYVRTGANAAGQAVTDAVPTGFEIKRIETLIGDLDEVIAKQQGKLVKQRLDLEYLQAEVERCNQRVEHLTAEVASAKQLLQTPQVNYTIGDRQYSQTVVEREARNKAEKLIRAREIQAAKVTTLEALENALLQAEGQLAEARNQREQYNLRLTELEAKAENVAIRQELATSLDRLPNGIDTGSFQEVEAAFTRVEKDLAVQARLLDEHYRTLPQAEIITFSEPQGEDVLAVLDRALDRERPQQQAQAEPAAVQPTATTPPAIDFEPAPVAGDDRVAFEQR